MSKMTELASGTITAPRRSPSGGARTRSDGVPIEISPERREEFSPGLDAELLQMIQATAEQELRKVDEPGRG
jgi:hypothetical protein